MVNENILPFFRNDPDRKNLHRTYQVFKKNEWTLLMSQKLNSVGIKCGFQFKRHAIYTTSTTATFSGSCQCGNSLRGEILSFQGEVIKVSCFLLKDPSISKDCGKRHLTGDERLRFIIFPKWVG